MTDDVAVVERKGREGGRWINERPTSEAFVEWFTTSMKIDPALDVSDYIGGVVLIPGVDTKAKYVKGFTQDGKPIIDSREELSYVPYAKVETRTAYFWDLLAAHEEWVGVVERLTPTRQPIDFVHTEETEEGGITEGGQPRVGRTNRKLRTPGALTLLAHSLPEGFSISSVPVEGGYTHFLCCTTRVAIHRADSNGEPKGRPLRSGQGTKQVPLLKRGFGSNPGYADPDSLMKAETGALGRALGFAGIFVIPGSGVATAEDMLEMLAQGTPVAEAAPVESPPSLPDAAPVRTGAEQAVEDEAALKARAIALYQALDEHHPPLAEEFGLWANQRHLAKLGEARGATLRGVVRKLETLTDKAAQSPKEAADVPAPESSDSSSAAG